MTCKDCIHYCLCKDTLADENWREDTPQEIKDMYSPKGCENFKNKEKVAEWTPTNYFDEHYGRCYTCSRCGSDTIGTSNYCPNCGAEMDKEK